MALSQRRPQTRAVSAGYCKEGQPAPWIPCVTERGEYAQYRGTPCNHHFDICPAGLSGITFFFLAWYCVHVAHFGVSISFSVQPPGSDYRISSAVEAYTLTAKAGPSESLSKLSPVQILRVCQVMAPYLGTHIVVKA